MSDDARRYESLDALPTRLFRPVVTSLHGSLGARADAALAMWNSLLAGRAPPEDLAWPDPVARDALRDAIERSRLPEVCRGDPDVTEAVMLDLLEVVDDLDRLRARMAVWALRDARRGDGSVTAVRFGEASGGCDGGGPNSDEGGAPGVDAKTWGRMRDEAARITAQLADSVARGRVTDRWRERAAFWLELRGVIDALRATVPSGWTLDFGTLKLHEWREMVRIQSMLTQMRAARAWVDRIGHARHLDDPSQPTVLERALGRVRRPLPVTRVEQHEAPSGEVRGVERTRELARMLPAESVLLVRPALRGLWHARRADGMLLGYHAHGVATVRTVVEERVDEGGIDPRPRAGRGPVLLCIDTSGSMRGVPADVARAVALYAVSLAQSEGRACWLYAFSGPGQVHEYGLTPDLDGLTKLLEFLSLGFDGGTDVTEPVARAVARLDHEGWSNADLVVVSDGQFFVPNLVLDRVRLARSRHGARVHGMAVGYSPDAALRQLCDDVQRFVDWAALEAPA